MAKETNKSMVQRIADKSGILSPKQLQLAMYIEKNYMSLAYITMTELASLADVSETTVVRFVSQLGYNGFPDFMAALRKEVDSTSKPKTSMDKFDLEHKKYTFPDDTCQAIFTLEMQVMRDTLSKIDTKKHQKAVDMIFDAPAIIILGCGANKCCSQALGFALQVIHPKVQIIEKLGLSEAAIINDMPEGTVCIAFTTPRYPKETQEILGIIKNKNFKIIGISNSILAPIVQYSDIFFQIPVKYVTFIDTNAAFMALIHSLTFGLHLKDKRKIKQRIEEYNRFTKEHNYYVEDSLELVDF
ncbi:MAG: MurR/RpiR family transcriptional regulator [Cloacibacillus sp.]